jgi:hypothetical protein
MDAVEYIDSSVGHRGRDPRRGGNAGAKGVLAFVLALMFVVVMAKVEVEVDDPV